jgi:hypothetical protein
VAHYELSYAGEDDIYLGRDVHAYRFRVAADGKYLGAWVVLIDGRSIATLPADTDLDFFHQAGLFAAADKIRDLAEHGQLRSEYRQEVEEIVMSRAEVEIQNAQSVAVWDLGDTVSEFDA